MLLKEFETYIKNKIPLSKELNFELISFDNGEVVMHAPFEKNKNDKDTIFAGSQASLALLAGWSLVSLSFKQDGVNIVAAVKTEMHYIKPIESDFEIRAHFSKTADLDACRAMLTKKKRAKIQVDVNLSEKGSDLVKATFSGSYFLSL